MDNAKILDDKICNNCNWPIVFACCNGEFQNFKDAAHWDWWYYCSNKGCKDHDGEGIFQNDLDWVINLEVSK